MVHKYFAELYIIVKSRSASNCTKNYLFSFNLKNVVEALGDSIISVISISLDQLAIFVELYRKVE